MESDTTDGASRLGINVAGFLRGGLGLGEAGRLYVAALQQAGVPVRTTTVDPRMPDVVGPSGVRAAAKTIEFTDLETDAETPFNLVCVNAPELPQFYREVGPEFFARKRTIGVWAWEVDAIPGDWEYSFELVDEIWVYSAYVRDILAAASAVPVVRVPLPIVPRATAAAPPYLGLRDEFTFLFLFDFYSTTQRKNPLGLIEAFKRAFRPGEGPQLLLKSYNGDFKPERLAAVERAAKGHADVHVVDRYLSVGEKDALMQSCDCYVSLHRAEGYGLTLAEAMAAGKPVIATGYSGNTDFMSADNSYLVDYRLTAVGPEGENYPSEGRWAEPDIDHAARLMRSVWEDRDEAAARSERGRVDVLRETSLERVAAIAAGRLEDLTRQGLARPRASRRPPAPPPAGLAALRHAELTAERDPLVLARDLGGGRGAWRQTALRAMKPYTAHQDEFNAKSIEALREVADRLAELHRVLAYLGTETPLDQEGYDLARVLAGMRARPASSHPAISMGDEAGRVVLGFDLAQEDPTVEQPGFEDVFRGSEELIRERQAVYADVLGAAGAVLDLGCGRGEFLDELRERGIPARGVELSEELVAYCREKGHEVELADAIDHLRSLEEASVPAVFAAQVVEHLPAEVLRDLLKLTEAKLEPGGTAIFETVNPHTPSALKAFWTDPTHHHPVYPEVLIALCRFAGFASGRVIFPEPTGDFNEDIYDSPDYAVVVSKREAV